MHHRTQPVDAAQGVIDTPNFIMMPYREERCHFAPWVDTV